MWRIACSANKTDFWKARAICHRPSAIGFWVLG